MVKTAPFTIRLSEEVSNWSDREHRATKMSKSALLETLAEESIRVRQFPGISFRETERSRRAWVMGTPLDVWELIELYRGKGRDRLFAEHVVTTSQLDLAMAYHDAFPPEIDEALDENARSPEEWHRLYPSVVPRPARA